MSCFCFNFFSVFILLKSFLPHIGKDYLRLFFVLFFKFCFYSFNFFSAKYRKRNVLYFLLISVLFFY